MMTYESGSCEETFELGKKLGESASPGSVFALTGDLGAGKTVFAKGFAEGLGVRETITSPTFTIMQLYESGRIPLAHFDVYRIDDPDEMDEIGFDEFTGGDGAALVEWADRITELMPENTVWINIRRDPAHSDSGRIIEISGDVPR